MFRVRTKQVRIKTQQQIKFSYHTKKVENKSNSTSQMKYYEENSAAMSEDDDNVDIESDVSVFDAEFQFSRSSQCSSFDKF